MPRRRTRARRIGIGNEARSSPMTRSSPRRPSRTPGLFLVHRVGDKIFYEIPPTAFGKDLLWVTQLAATQSGYGYGGSPVNHRVVRWEQRGDDILLRDVKYSIRAEAKDPIRNAVEATSVPEIIEVFPVRAYGKDKAPVIEVTRLFTADLPEFSAKRRLGASGVDPRRTFIDGIKSFPENIETKVLMTYRPREASPPGGGGPGRPPRAPGGDPSQGGVTVLLHHSMVKLPENPMRPRRYDDRVGFFTEEFEDYGNVKNHQVENVRYITRWRLEKKDPSAEVSEPKKPIVFYLGREIPEKWRPWVKKGVEAWQDSFEQAGFKNAILAKDAPSPQEDPDWDAEDARYSSLRWLPATIENAMGPHVHDPRTGEILESDILMYHNVLKLIRDWYFVQASPNDPRAQSLPLPDDLIGELLAYVVSHEVGHTLGFRHNMKASSAYTVEQLRAPRSPRRTGSRHRSWITADSTTSPSPATERRLIPIIGPYDKFAVEWGYREFKGARTYDDEKKELDTIVSRQLKDPALRFGDPNPTEDPSQQTEDLGSDALTATSLGLKNIDRVAGFLVKARGQEGRELRPVAEHVHRACLAAAPRAGACRQPGGGLRQEQHLVRRRRPRLRSHPRVAAARGGPLLERERVAGGAGPGRARDPRSPRVPRRGRSHPRWPTQSPAHAPDRAEDQPDGRIRQPRRDGRLSPGRVDRRPPRRHLGRAEVRVDRHRPLPAQPPARLRRDPDRRSRPAANQLRPDRPGPRRAPAHAARDRREPR